jgi:AcrR family transcriptional regulator
VEQADPGPRARIRDAALRQFAAHGFKGATVRGIARDAGVSPGLVQHHYPSKQALREACDAYGLAVLRDVWARGVAGGALRDDAFLSEADQVLGDLAPYVAMALVSDAATVSSWFDELAELYHEILTSGAMGPALPEDADAEAIVAVYTAMELGIAVFARHLYRRLGAGEPDRRANARISLAKLFLATERLVGADLEAGIRAGFDDYLRADERDGDTDD